MLVDVLQKSGVMLGTHEGVSEHTLERLGIDWPVELKDVLRESNGFEDLAGQWEVAWSAERIVQENVRIRRDFPEVPAHLLGFGDNGAGDPFLIDRLDGTVHVLSGVTGECWRIAESLSSFWPGWFAGTITS